MPWCSARTFRPAIVISPMLKNLISGSGPPLIFSSSLERGGALHLVAVEPAVVRVHGRALVALDRGVVVAGLAVVLHPVVRRRSPDEVEEILVEVEEDRVADHVAVVVAGDELLGLVDLERREAVDTGVREQLERIRALDVHVGHVVATDRTDSTSHATRAARPASSRTRSERSGTRRARSASYGPDPPGSRRVCSRSSRLWELIAASNSSCRRNPLDIRAGGFRGRSGSSPDSPRGMPVCQDGVPIDGTSR